MLSRRDKLLLQPWEVRRFKDHRLKVQSASPSVDDSRPPLRPHVSYKLKKSQKEEDRKTKIQNENFSLLQRLNAIMKVNRLDNHWKKPLPNIHKKVGLFYDTQSLQSRLSSRSVEQPAASSAPVKCYACELRRTSAQLSLLEAERRLSTPSLPPI